MTDSPEGNADRRAAEIGAKVREVVRAWLGVVWSDVDDRDVSRWMESRGSTVNFLRFAVEYLDPPLPEDDLVEKAARVLFEQVCVHTASRVPWEEMPVGFLLR